MELKEIIEALEGLEEGTGLWEEENWDNSHETQKWRLTSIVAINKAIELLKNGEIVGILEINGEKYKVSK